MNHVIEFYSSENLMKVLIANAQDLCLFRDLAGGSSSVLSGVPGGTNTGVVQLADLQRILSGLGQPSGADIIPFKLSRWF
jgi:hypothetical protein